MNALTAWAAANAPWITGGCFAVFLACIAGRFAGGSRKDDETETPQPRRAATALGAGGAGTTSITAGPLFDSPPHVIPLPASVRERDKWARALWNDLGARKAAEYDAVLDVMAGEQDTAVMDAVAS